LATKITNIHARYNDLSGIPHSESFDVQEWEDGDLVFDEVIRDWLADGATNIRLEIDTEEEE
jgi:hypothetical protein